MGKMKVKEKRSFKTKMNRFYQNSNVSVSLFESACDHCLMLLRWEKQEDTVKNLNNQSIGTHNFWHPVINICLGT